ncbi:hypothetical protein ZIOFF_072699 [Zingiber officinale]|uniref:Mitochondrial-processing peptidase subunit alpha n=1 Tax=Zingiber officinale TaxID=94328 RepID=A0A8J5BZ82_ZINOF|nr:hypothetical protein ZIOFF_072699 [Zingiber officinale]
MSVSPVLASDTHGNLDEQIAQLMQCKPLAEQEGQAPIEPNRQISSMVEEAARLARHFCEMEWPVLVFLDSHHPNKPEPPYLPHCVSPVASIGLSQLRMVREIEAIGGSAKASASREQMGYTYDALKLYTPQMVELKKLKTELGELSSNPQGLLLEAVHSAGYSGALANPLIAPESAISHLNGTILEGFVSENYTAPRIVLAASGVEHKELVSLAEPLLSDLPKVPRPQEPKSVYVGGEHRCQSDLPSTHIALAFEIPGGWRQEKEAMAATVLQVLMGGGGSFSTGGPGKGMHSRLCTLKKRCISASFLSFFLQAFHF